MSKSLQVGVVFALVAAALIGVAALPAREKSPVGYYDPQKVYAQSREARAASSAAGETLRGARSAAEHAVAVYNEAKKTPVDEKTLADKQAVAEQTDVAYKRKVEELKDAFDVRLYAVVEKIAVKHGMALVLPMSGRIPYAVPGADITADVIAQLDGDDPELAAARKLIAEHDRVKK